MIFDLMKFRFNYSDLGRKKNKKDSQDIDKFIEELEGKSDEELSSFANQKAQEIFENISKIQEKIDEAEKLTAEAEKAETDLKYHFSRGLFGKNKTEKQTELNTKAISQHSEALEEMSNLIQESVFLTKGSMFFAKKMVEAMSLMMVGGFKDKDGKIIELSEEQKKHANIILQEAKNFVKQQMELEKRENEQEKNIIKLQENIQEIKNIKIKNLKTKIEILQEQINKKSSFVPYLISALSLIVAIVSLVLNFIDFKN